jgi:CHAD domain-containing protein
MVTICRRHEQSFLRSLQEARGLHEKQVHRLRVDVKNLRVLLQLQNVLSGSKKPAVRIQKLVSPLFDSAGTLRSAALNLNLTSGYRSPALIKFRKQLKERKQTAASELRLAIDNFDNKKFSRLNKKIASDFGERKNKKLKRDTAEYLRVLFARVRSELFDINDDETLHEIRKKLKVIKNLGALMSELDRNHLFTEELLRINKTYEKIGEWHDVAVLLEELEQFLKDLNDPRVSVKTAPLLQHLRRRTVRSKKLIEKKLKVDLMM